jgi:lipoprotein-anchoring transpeptidase ErfK/SrfK
MPNPESPQLTITVDKTAKTLTLIEASNGKTTQLLVGNVVVGCDGTETPSGEFVAAPWQLNPTDPTFGPKPWTEDKWANPYGPYFLRLVLPNGMKTNYGIHGTRGPMDGITGSWEKPPAGLTPDILKAIYEAKTNKKLSDDDLKYLSCSHGCIRLSNQNIEKLFQITNRAKYSGKPIKIIVK